LTYTLLSFTRFGKEILTQLNYIIWFPARPKVNALDIYGGDLDGVNFRVTLDMDGEPLLYESIHNCGCYYGAYPTRRLKPRERIDYAEPPLIFKAPELALSREVMTVAMETRTHYVQHLYPCPAAASKRWFRWPITASFAVCPSRRRACSAQPVWLPAAKAGRSSSADRCGLPGAMQIVPCRSLRGERFDDPFSIEKMFIKTIRGHLTVSSTLRDDYAGESRHVNETVLAFLPSMRVHVSVCA
jgi:hypothetical protein